MKKIIIILISLLTIIGCVGQESYKETDLQKQELKGKIKSQTKTTYRYKTTEKSGKIQKEEQQSKLVSYFNKDGNFTERIFYDKEKGTIRQEFSYDEKGNLIEIKGYEANGTLGTKITYKYDQKDNRIEENTYSEGVLQQKNTYKYDQDNREIEVIRNVFAFWNGGVKLRQVNEYDTKGKKIEERNFSNNNELTSKALFSYDEKGNLIEEYFVNLTDKEPSKKNTYVYDNNDNKIEEKKCVYQNLSENIDRKVCKFYVTNYYKYDEKGNKIEDSFSDFEKSIFYKVKYKNDSKGNAVESIYYTLENTPFLIEEIEIEYY